jgi:hypothetical protein
MTVAAAVAFLAAHLGWACDEHPAIREFAAELRQLTKTLTAAVAHGGDTRGEKIGRCPAVTRDDTRCAAPLRVDPYVDQIQCGRCGTRWDRRGGGWLRLRSEQVEADREERA